MQDIKLCRETGIENNSTTPREKLSHACKHHKTHLVKYEFLRKEDFRFYKTSANFSVFFATNPED